MTGFTGDPLIGLANMLMEKYKIPRPLKVLKMSSVPTVGSLNKKLKEKKSAPKK